MTNARMFRFHCFRFLWYFYTFFVENNIPRDVLRYVYSYSRAVAILKGYMSVENKRIKIIYLFKFLDVLLVLNLSMYAIVFLLHYVFLFTYLHGYNNIVIGIIAKYTKGLSI